MSMIRVPVLLALGRFDTLPECPLIHQSDDSACFLSAGRATSEPDSEKCSKSGRFHEAAGLDYALGNSSGGECQRVA